MIRGRKFKRTTDSDHAFNIAPNLLRQDFATSGPNQKWAGDITYAWTREGWAYLAPRNVHSDRRHRRSDRWRNDGDSFHGSILDLFSRRVVGWAIEPTA